MKLLREDAVIAVSAHLFKAAQVFAGKGDVRYYLNGVRVEPHLDGGALLVATNGHALLCLHDVDGIAKRPAILPRLPATALREKFEVRMHAEHGTVWVADRELDIPRYVSADGEILGNYPVWTAVLKPLDAYAPGLVSTFQLPILQQALSVANLAPIRFFHDRINPANGSIFTLGAIGFGVLMPMRWEDEKNSLAASIPAYLLPKPRGEG